MHRLTPDLLRRACRVFLDLAYPEGPATIPRARAAFLELDDAQSLDAVLLPPLCQELVNNERVRGYAIRLGGAHYPHLKLQVVNCDHSDIWVFAVDTHDGVRLDRSHPDAGPCAQIQAVNRRLKEDIERAWEAEGLLTFNALLRRGLDNRRSDLDCGAKVDVTALPSVARTP